VGPDSAPSPPAPRKRARECCDEHVQQQSPPRRAALLVAVPAMEIPEEEEELAPKRGLLLLRLTRRPAGLRLLHAPRVWDGGVRGPAADVRAERTCRCCRSRARAAPRRCRSRGHRARSGGSRARRAGGGVRAPRTRGDAAARSRATADAKGVAHGTEALTRKVTGAARRGGSSADERGAPRVQRAAPDVRRALHICQKEPAHLPAEGHAAAVHHAAARQVR
jgi:hypothetical protein